MHEPLTFLTDIPLFRGLSDEEAAQIAGAACRKVLPTNHVLYVEGLEASIFAILVRGKAKAVLTGSGGGEVLLDYYLPGDTIGEMNVSDLAYYPFDLVTLEPSEFVLISRQAMIDLMKTNGEVAYLLAGSTVRRLLLLHRRVRSLALDRGQKRILSFFAEFGRRLGRETDEGLLIDTALSHQAIADACGFSRETITRLLGELSSNGELVRNDEGWLLPRR